MGRGRGFLSAAGDAGLGAGLDAGSVWLGLAGGGGGGGIGGLGGGGGGRGGAAGLVLSEGDVLALAGAPAGGAADAQRLPAQRAPPPQLDGTGRLELEIPAGGDFRTVFDIESFDELDKDPIIFGDHCYGCTAGGGSSCDGSLAS